MIHASQDLIAQIRGWEYLIAIAFVLLFIPFWRALNHEKERPKRAQRVGVPASSARRSAGAQGETVALRRDPKTISCWESRQCPPEVRDQCPAYTLAPIPCWVACQLANGERSRPCATCPIHTQAMKRVVEARTNGGREVADQPVGAAKEGLE